jgi:hypothetical protein
MPHRRAAEQPGTALFTYTKGANARLLVDPLTSGRVPPMPHGAVPAHVRKVGYIGTLLLPFFNKRVDNHSNI